MPDGNQEKRVSAQPDGADGSATGRSTGAPDRSTPVARGSEYETAIHKQIEQFAASWGDEYLDTATTPGYISRCRKGDGLLIILDQPGAVEPIRVVIEVTLEKGGRRNWSAYLDECKVNRQAQVALGLVPSPAQVPGGKPVRTFGASRMVLAFDPDRDDPCVLEAALQLLRYEAITAASRRGAGRVHEAGEKLAEARELIGELNSLYAKMTLAREHIDTVANELESVRARVHRLLTGAGHDLEEAGPADDDPTFMEGTS